MLHALPGGFEGVLEVNPPPLREKHEQARGKLVLSSGLAFPLPTWRWWQLSEGGQASQAQPQPPSAEGLGLNSS